MAEILALGISHYPPLHGQDDRMSWILKRMLQNPKLQRAAHPAGWPAAMRAEWGNDEGASSAARHRADLVAWMDKTRAALDAFKPDFVLIWGDDQYENFKEDVVPPYCISAYESFKFASPPGNVWGETDKTYELRAIARRQDAGDTADRGRLRHGLCLQAVASSAGPRLHQRDHVSRLPSQGLRLSDRALRHQLLRPACACPAWRPAGVRSRHRRCRSRSPGADTQAAVRHGRGNGARAGGVALPCGTARFVGLEPCLPPPPRTISCGPTRRPTGACTRRCATATGRPGAAIRVLRSRTAASRRS